MARKQWYKQRKNAEGEVVNKTLMANDTPDSAEALEKDGWSDKRPKNWVDPPGDLGGETHDLAKALARVKELEEKLEGMQEAVPLSKRNLVTQVGELTAMLEKENQVNEELVAKIEELTTPQDAPDDDNTEGEGETDE